MYKKIVSALYSLNILIQAIYSLAVPIGVGALASFLLTKYASFPDWIWAVLLILGVFVGLYSMVKFVLTASENLERLEKQQSKKISSEKGEEKKQ